MSFFNKATVIYCKRSGQELMHIIMSVAPIHAKLTIWGRERNNKFRRGVNNCLLVTYDESSTIPILCSFPQKWSTSRYAAIGETLIKAYDPYN